MHNCERPSPLLNFLDHIQFSHCCRHPGADISPTVGDRAPSESISWDLTKLHLNDE